MADQIDIDAPSTLIKDTSIEMTISGLIKQKTSIIIIKNGEIGGLPLFLIATINFPIKETPNAKNDTERTVYMLYDKIPKPSSGIPYGEENDEKV